MVSAHVKGSHTATPARPASISHEQRQHACIAIEPVMRDLAIAEEADQGKFSERLPDQLELFGVGSEQAGAAPDAGVVDPPAGLREHTLSYALQHALHVFLRGLGIAPAEQDARVLLQQLADRDQLVRRVDPHEIAHHVVAGVAARYRQTCEYVSSDPVNVAPAGLPDIFSQDIDV